jgi:hypothetical protein
MTEKRIVKVIYTDDTFDEVVNPKPFEIREGEKHWEAFRRYERQFRDLEESVLRSIDNDIVEDYAKDYFDLIDPDDCECDCEEKDVSDFEDSDLLNEISRRYFGKNGLDIIANSIFDRFIKVLSVADKSELDEILKNQEIKHKII